MVKLGDKFVLPDLTSESVHDKDFHECEVVYIHPEGRFCVVMFTDVKVPYRQSFKLDQNGNIMINGHKEAKEILRNTEKEKAGKNKKRGKGKHKC